MPTDEQIKEVIGKIKTDFKKEFDYDLTEDDICQGDDGVEIDYRDYDLNMITKYHHSSLVDTSRFESDGRCEYVRVTAFIKYDEYL